MNVPNGELDRWARVMLEVRATLTKISDRLQFSGAPEELQEMALKARTKAHDLLRAMKQAGAEDPMEAVRREMQADAYDPPKPVPLELLSSPNARAYAATIRAAAVACRAMEEERGITDGYAEHLEAVARAAEFEVYGPKGLREG